MWPWLMILAGTLLIIGALVARHRILQGHRARRDQDEREASSGGTAFAHAVHAATVTSRRELKAARAAGQPVLTGPPPLFADLPVGHRLTAAPTVRVRAQDLPLQDWLRYHADGSAWPGVIQGISDRVTSDPLLQPYFGTMDRTTLQRHVMSTVIMLTGEGVTVGAVRRLADAHLRHVQSGGAPVTEPVWNRMASTLGNALREHDAPEAAILSLNATAAPLRSVIVSREQVTHPVLTEGRNVRHDDDLTPTVADASSFRQG